MWQLLGSLVNTFLLLRDLFGYLVPGFALALAILIVRGDLLDRVLAFLAIFPVWAAALLAAGACYVIGQLLAAVGYMFYDLVNWLRLVAKYFFEKEETGKTPRQRLKSWRQYRKEGKAKASQSTAEIAYYRYLYPNLFHDADRRGVMNILRIGLTVALLIVSAMPQIWLWPGLALLILGLFLVYNSWTGMEHVRDQQKIALKTAQWAEQNKLPFFRWDGGAEKKKEPET